MGSWLKDEKTIRVYRINDKFSCTVQHEYQTVKCPSPKCNEMQFCRLTRFWLYLKNTPPPQPTLHTNYSTSLEELKKLLVQRVDGKAVTERLVDGGWVLEKDGRVWGTKIDADPTA